jgi:hypothetical protein
MSSMLPVECAPTFFQITGGSSGAFRSEAIEQHFKAINGARQTGPIYLSFAICLCHSQLHPFYFSCLQYREEGLTSS